MTIWVLSVFSLLVLPDSQFNWLEHVPWRIILPGERGVGREGEEETHKYVQWQTLVLAVRTVRVLLPELVEVARNHVQW
jgi:hypothetical protein